MNDLELLLNCRFGLAKLDAEIIKYAKGDLKKADPRLVSRGAHFFFFDGTGVDENDAHTFTALCKRHSIDPNRAAKAIWESLPEEKKIQICYLLEVEVSAPVYEPVSI